LARRLDASTSPRAPMTVAAIEEAAALMRMAGVTGNVAEAIAAAGARFDVIQAEKFEPEVIAEVAGALARLSARPILAAAGDIHPGNAPAYAHGGADVLAVHGASGRCRRHSVGRVMDPPRGDLLAPPPEHRREYSCRQNDDRHEEMARQRVLTTLPFVVRIAARPFV
jgi:hypothetical protein